MKYIFLDENGQPRSGWRVTVFLITFLVFGGTFVYAAKVLLAGLPFGPEVGSYLPLTVSFSLSAIIALFMGWFYGRVFEDLPFRALGISFRDRWLSNLLAGGVIGSLALCSALIVALVGGGVKLTINHDSSSSAIVSTLGTTFIVFAVGALSEETLFRGYLLQTLTRSKQIVAGFLLTSFLFALVHNNNPDANFLSLTNTFFAGIWFAAAYLKTRDLWFPIGIHLMWNWLQGPIFGINVSGVSEFSPDPLFRAADAGPVWLTGGSYGIEGGVACTFAILISIGLVWLLPWPRNVRSEPSAVAGG
jgi:uncharacterized protein